MFKNSEIKIFKIALCDMENIQERKQTVNILCGGNGSGKTLAIKELAKDKDNVFYFTKEDKNIMGTVNDIQSEETFSSAYYEAFWGLVDEIFIIKGCRERILGILQGFSDKIEDLQACGKKILVSMPFSNRMLPLEALGNGMVEIFEALCFLLHGNYNMFLFDDLLDRLDSENQIKFLEVVLNIAKEREITVFFTTCNQKFLEEN